MNKGAIELKILVVDDEKLLVKGLKYNLEQEGYMVSTAFDGEEAVRLAHDESINLILLDLMLPKLDGLSACRQIREFSNVPIIMLTARSDDIDKILGLEYGADDYITKPFGTFELLARIRTAIRHNNRLSDDPMNSNRPYSAGDLVIDFEKRLVKLEGEEIHLTRVEYKIVSLLARNSGKVMTYDTLINEVWGPYADDNNRILRVNMANIRRKLEKNPGEPKYIFTELGVGYRMLEDEGLSV